jgi:hypothetical protein
MWCTPAAAQFQMHGPTASLFWCISVFFEQWFEATTFNATQCESQHDKQQDVLQAMSAAQHWAAGFQVAQRQVPHPVVRSNCYDLLKWEQLWHKATAKDTSSN